MAKQIAVIGLGRFGSRVARTLHQMGHNVLAIDSDPRIIEEHRGITTYPVQADATAESVLHDLGITEYDIIVVAISTNVTSNIMTTVLLLSLGVGESNIIARANNRLHADTLRRLGIEKIITPEEETGTRLAHTIFSQELREYIALTPNYGVGMLRSPDHWADKSLRELGFSGNRDRHHVVVLALRRDRNVILAPDEDERVIMGDWLLLAGTDEGLETVVQDH